MQKQARKSAMRNATVLFEGLEGRLLLAAQPVITYGTAGPTTLSYNGASLFRSGDGLRPSEYGVLNSNGTITPTAIQLTDYTTQWNASSHVLTWTFSWGTVATTFVQTGTRVNLATTVHNTSSKTIEGFGMYWDIHFPTRPVGFDGVTPVVSFGADGPAVETADFKTGAIAVVNTDATALYSGFFAVPSSPVQNVYQLWISGTARSWQPPGWPIEDRAVAAGASDTYHVSLRFGATGSTSQTLAPDAYATTIASNPDTVVWPDRHPIGEDYLASGAGVSATNPRGWFGDPSVNVTTQAGLAAFSQRLLAYADTSVAELKKENAQGVIMWDIEGEQYPQPTTYIGDPRLATTLAPELNYNGLLSKFFQKFTNAGLRVGVTIRETQLVVSGNTASQTTVANAAQELIDKINYAKQEWGCSLFYVDSNIPETTVNAQDVFKLVLAAEPGILLVPEHVATVSYASSAAYVAGNIYPNLLSGTPASVRATYPSAFSVVNVSDVTWTPAALAAATSAVEGGDILMFRSWFNDPVDSTLTKIYQTANAATAAAAAAAAAAAQALTVPANTLATIETTTTTTTTTSSTTTTRTTTPITTGTTKIQAPRTKAHRVKPAASEIAQAKKPATKLLGLLVIVKKFIYKPM